jgi:hypothetical protein
MAMNESAPLAPGVAVGDLLQDVRLLVEGLAADLDVHAEVGAHVEGRVDVDQLQPALPPRSASAARRLFSDDRISLLSPQISLLVQPLSCRPRGSKRLAGTVSGAVRRAARPRARASGRAARVVQTSRAFAVPDQLDLALVLEQEEAVFLRQRLALLDQRDQVALAADGAIGRGEREDGLVRLLRHRRQAAVVLQAGQAVAVHRLGRGVRRRLQHALVGL